MAKTTGTYIHVVLGIMRTEVIGGGGVLFGVVVGGL